MRYNYGHPTYGNNRRNDRYWSNDLKAYMTYEDWKQLSSEERSRRHRDLENSNNPGKQSQKMVWITEIISQPRDLGKLMKQQYQII